MGVQERLSMQGSSVKAFHRDDRGAESADKQTPDVANIARDIGTTLVQVVGKHPENASPHDWFQAIAYFARGRMADRWLDSKAVQHQKDVKTVYYLSMEFLVGRSLRNHLYNLGLDELCRTALETFGVDLDKVYEEENDAALGSVFPQGGADRLHIVWIVHRIPAVG